MNLTKDEIKILSHPQFRPNTCLVRLRDSINYKNICLKLKIKNLIKITANGWGYCEFELTEAGQAIRSLLHI